MTGTIEVAQNAATPTTSPNTRAGAADWMRSITEPEFRCPTPTCRPMKSRIGPGAVATSLPANPRSWRLGRRERRGRLALVTTTTANQIEEVARATGRATSRATRIAQAETVSTPVALRRGRWASVVATACLAGFGAIFGLVRARRSEAVDLAIMLRMQRRAQPALDAVMGAASWPGFPPQSRVLPALLVGGLAALRFRTEAAFQLAGWGTALVSTGLKALMRRPRPMAGTDLRVVAAPLGGSSFPSGHVITYVGTYGFAAYLASTLLKDRAGRAPVTAALLAPVVLVGPSRIYQGHHWPTDVTASYLLGTSYLIGLAALYRRAKARAEAGR